MMYLHEPNMAHASSAAFDGAIAQAYLLGADEMEAVVVAVDAVVNIDAVEKNALALDDANAVIGAIEQRNVAARKSSRSDTPARGRGACCLRSRWAAECRAPRNEIARPGRRSCPGPSMVTFFAFTAKSSAQFPSLSVVSPCSGIASTA